VLALALAAPVYAASDAPSADDVKALRGQVELLMQRIKQLEAQQNAQKQAIEDQKSEQKKLAKKQEEVTIAPANVVTAGDEPGSFKIPGTNTSVKIGGYVKADMIYNVDEDLGNSLLASNVVTGATPTKAVPTGEFNLLAAQTRFNIKTSTPTKLGSLKTTIEGDFEGGAGNERVSNSRHFRLRHAWGQLGHFRFGQTWSNFQNWHYGSTVDFGGPSGQIFIRQTQFRYMGDINDHMAYSVALENPAGLLQTPTAAAVAGATAANPAAFANGAAASAAAASAGARVRGKDIFPDVTGRLEWNNGGGGTSATAAVALRFYDFGNIAGLKNGGTETGYGFTVGATQKFGANKVQLTGTYGDGLGRYLYHGFLNGGTHIAADGSVDTTEEWGATASLGRKWTSKLSTNLIYGITSINLPGNLYPTSNQNLQTVHANLMYTPWDRVSYGLEFQWAHRETQTGKHGDAPRVVFGAKYAF